ncbi:MAG: hypothetical protein GY863_05580 [bacterium]|nr:hypothetical protein [bacterium]
MYMILEGIKNLLRTKLAALIVMVVIGLALSAGTLFFLLTMKLRESSDYLTSLAEIEAFLPEGITEAATGSLKTTLEQDPAVSVVVFISKDSAAAIFKTEIGEDIRELIPDENPLPASFRIRLRNEFLTSQKYDSLLTVFTDIDGIDEVLSRSGIVFQLLEYRKFIKYGHAALGLTILLLSVFLISNIIRLSINSRSKSIEIMKLVGAKNSFIRGPFIIEGMIIGIAGSALSVFFVIMMNYCLQYFMNIGFTLPEFYYIYLVVSGIFLSVISTFIALGRFLKMA